MRKGCQGFHADIVHYIFAVAGKFPWVSATHDRPGNEENGRCRLRECQKNFLCVKTLCVNSSATPPSAHFSDRRPFQIQAGFSSVRTDRPEEFRPSSPFAAASVPRALVCFPEDAGPPRRWEALNPATAHRNPRSILERRRRGGGSGRGSGGHQQEPGLGARAGDESEGPGKWPTAYPSVSDRLDPRFF